MRSENLSHYQHLSGMVIMLALAFVCFVFSASAQDGSADNIRTIKLLTIGNSFAENACYYLPQIGKSVNVNFVIGRANRSGCSLETHWKRAELNLKDPENPEGKYGNPGEPSHKGLKDKLTEQPWDFITIQQFSVISHAPETYQPWADKIVEMVREYAPQAKLLVHQTWAYRADSPRFTGNAVPGHPTSKQEMYEKLRDSYYSLAKHFNAGLLPSGDAFYTADTDPQWGFKPLENVDMSQFSHPKLPDQRYSLHSGYFWQKDKEGNMIMKFDANHCNRAGLYLAGLVWLQTLTGIDATQVTFVPEGVDAAHAEYLKKVASQAVQKSNQEFGAVSGNEGAGK